VVERTVELSEVPAPSGAEHQRSSLVAQWWKDDGLDAVSIDGAGNVWGRLSGDPPEPDGPAILVCAHLDTVFDESVQHRVRRDGDTLYGPGVGDNGVAVAALSAASAGVEPGLRVPVWLVATTGEEGLGNLRGIYHALNSFPGAIGAVVAVEGNYLGRIGTRGVSSERWAVEVCGPGGHSWEAADNPSAVHEASRMVCELVATLEPGTPRRTVNVGRFQGGDNVTSRAPGASLLVDMRSEDPAGVPVLRQRLVRAARSASERGVGVSLHQLGRRGGGWIGSDHPLVAIARQAHADERRTVELVAASTDANAAYDLGIPAITLGITEGARQHSLEEWISISPISSGLAVLARTVSGFAAHLVDGGIPGGAGGVER
jgi:acetylornithine deacetylase/succinyl-diaminopimelate desuccinylase-like protein